MTGTSLLCRCGLREKALKFPAEQQQPTSPHKLMAAELLFYPSCFHCYFKNIERRIFIAFLLSVEAQDLSSRKMRCKDWSFLQLYVRHNGWSFSVTWEQTIAIRMYFVALIFVVSGVLVWSRFGIRCEGKNVVILGLGLAGVRRPVSICCDAGNFRNILSLSSFWWESGAAASTHLSLLRWSKQIGMWESCGCFSTDRRLVCQRCKIAEFLCASSNEMRNFPHPRRNVCWRQSCKREHNRFSVFTSDDENRCDVGS